MSFMTHMTYDVYNTKMLSQLHMFFQSMKLCYDDYNSKPGRLRSLNLVEYVTK